MIRILDFRREELLEDSNKERFIDEIYVKVPEDPHLRILGRKGLFMGTILMLYQAMTQSFRAVVLWCVNVS